MLKSKVLFVVFAMVLVVGMVGMPVTHGAYQLVWSDEFDGSAVNTSKWTMEIGGGGWGNNELQYYRAENATVSGGILTIAAKKENYGGYAYTSSRMFTKGKFAIKYGKIEARLSIPMGQGLWPAFWMLGANIDSVSWPRCGEIDIMEHVNNETKVYGTIHWDNNGYVHYGGNTICSTPSSYHTYSVEWNSAAIKWYYDGVLYHEANILNNINSTEEFHQPFFIILNLAIGGNWPGSPDAGTPFPSNYRVDYVRVYQDIAATPTPTPSGSAYNVPGKVEAEKYIAMSGVQTEACSEGTQNVGWIETGDWMDYRVNVTAAAAYNVEFRVSSPNSTGKIDLKSGATVKGTVNVPNTGGWQSWTTVTMTNISLSVGTQTLRVAANVGGWNINWLNFVSGGGGGSNLALNKPVTVSSTENAGVPGSNAVDGNSGTRWSSAFSDPQWIRVDLGSNQTVGKVVLKWEAAFGRSFKIQTSTDGNNWTDKYSTTTGDGGTDTITFAATTARYVRMYGTARATAYGYSLWEFEVYQQ